MNESLHLRERISGRGPPPLQTTSAPKTMSAQKTVTAAKTKSPSGSSDVLVSSVVYTSLLPTEIRVVEIQPGGFHDHIEIVIKVVNLDDHPIYDALSYVWHPQDGSIENSDTLDVARVFAHQTFLMPLGANLEAAIRHLRLQDVCLTLWIDALCINQKNPMERNHQVSLMKNIYSSADHVLIWLGPALGESNFCIQALQSRPLKTERDVIQFVIALAILFLRNWFTRVWVSHLGISILTLQAC